MARFSLVVVVALSLAISMFPDTTTAQLKTNFYGKSCPNVEKIVKKVVQEKVKQTFVTIPATLRLFFHDCFVNGCDASVMIQSTPNNKAEKDHPDNLSLAGDGFDVVIKAKKAIDAIPSCKNKVSCADILTLATRDVVVAAGGPSYTVELGRFDGLVSTAASVNGNLPGPNFKVTELNKLFAKNKLTQEDMIALSAAHTLGFAHCGKVFNRIYNFNRTHSVDPTLNKAYAKELQLACPKKVDPRIAINMDPTTPRKFDNIYFKNLQQGKGLFTSDQVLFTDARSRPTVNDWAKNSVAFNNAFITAMTKLGRVGVKTRRNGNIRRDCGAFN
ncbi:hem peroxidase [Arabidopsis thaliana x Arabidopsis arenosa]|uniref:peroxidase n=1 Tax=Arabidopsis thaliana x Arabidopsis arenosa TaxID=1240361 RepID=A0A8T1XPA6_9BRAS|nr:hem peroxidase [Arabidopsis thaliana x Arabidopsis arenosa]